MNRKERRSRAKSGTGAGPGAGGTLPPAQAQKMLQEAAGHHQAGRSRQAGPLYDRVLAAYPDQPDALHLSGILLTQVGQAAEGVKRLRRATEIVPDRAEFHANLGQALAVSGQPKHAMDALRRAVALKPTLHDAHNNMATLFKEQGAHAEAEAAYRKAIEVKPDFAGGWNNLGNLLDDLGRTSEARDALEKAVEIAPGYAGSHANLGALLLRQGDDAAGERHLRRALELSPGLRQAHEHLGRHCLDTGRYDEAVTHFRAALDGGGDIDVRLNLANALRQTGALEEAETLARKAADDQPGRPDALRVLGAVLRDRRKLADAEAVLDRARDLVPNDPATLNALAGVLDSQGRLGEAAALYRAALEHRPDYPNALNNLGVCLLNQGRIAEAETALERALELEPGSARAASNLLMLSNYGTAAPGDIFASHLELAGIGRPSATADFAGRDRDPDRQLRIGLVSGDFRRHSVAFFLPPLLAHLDREAVHVTCYANVRRPDEVTDHLKAQAGAWRDIVGLSDDDALALVRDDAIDILMDLSGHTRGNRLGLFAKRAAPVQATWLGYPNTTGLDAMDVRITDELSDPTGSADAVHSERLVRLPDGFLCYGGPGDAPDPGPPPAGTDGPVTFASFNNWSKVSGDTIAGWAAALHAVPESRIYLKARALADAETRERALTDFAGHGIVADRIEIAGWHADPRDHLADYRRCDIALDTWPYNGTTTTCEAFWMGVPVITRAGDRHAARVGASLLTAVGLEDLVAGDDAAFAQIAAGLAADRARLASLRENLRGTLQASPLGDGSAFARKFERALRGMWTGWVSG